jgi:signal transduction histidine kinase/DNA-binding response OmpR family regulator
MPSQIPDRIRARQLELLYRHQPFALLTSALIALCLLYFLRDFPDQQALLGWAFMLMLTLLFRAVTTFFFSRSGKTSQRPQRRYQLLFLIGIALSGLVWGLLGIWLYPLTSNVDTHLLLLIIMVGLASSTSATLFFHLLPVTLFVLLVLLPTIFSLYSTEGSQNTAIGLAIIFYIVFLLKSAHLFQKNYVQLLMLKEASLQKERKLRRSQRAAEEASRAKSNFLANMSHEIRTPLNVIIGMSRLIKETRLDEQQNKYFSRIESSATILMGLLNGILDFSKIEAGQLILEKQPFFLATLLDGIHSTMIGLAREKGLSLLIQKDPDVPEACIGDSIRLSQILINLIGNAIKFTNEGGEIRVNVKTLETDPDTGFRPLEFTVQDTGIGIAKNKQKILFESFQQADTSISRKYGGTGLGLAICRQLVQLMGGTISVSSKQGHGARFTFTVLLEPCSRELVKQVHIADSPVNEGRDRLSILLVEDNDANRELAIIVLESAGQAVTPAVDGLDALARLSEQRFDLILMDVQMPRMNGITATRMIRTIEQREPVPPTIGQELLAQLKARLAGGHIPIVAMTAHAMDSDRQRCLDAGMDDYLTKPFQPKQVLKVLTSFTPTRSVLAKDSLPMQTTGITGEETSEGPEQVSLDAVREHLHATYRLGQEQIDQLLATSAVSLCDHIAKAEEALRDNDGDTLREAAHAAKGNLLNLGLNDLGTLAARIEKEAEAGELEQCGDALRNLQAGLTDLLAYKT